MMIEQVKREEDLRVVQEVAEVEMKEKEVEVGEMEMKEVEGEVVEMKATVGLEVEKYEVMEEIHRRVTPPQNLLPEIHLNAGALKQV